MEFENQESLFLKNELCEISTGVCKTLLFTRAVFVETVVTLTCTKKANEINWIAFKCINDEILNSNRLQVLTFILNIYGNYKTKTA